LTEWIKSGKLAANSGDSRIGSSSLARTPSPEKLAAFVQWLVHDVFAGKDHDVEHVVENRRRAGAILESIERRPAGFVQSDDLAVVSGTVSNMGAVT
jgi:hypothetical protein